MCVFSREERESEGFVVAAVRVPRVADDLARARVGVVAARVDDRVEEEAVDLPPARRARDVVPFFLAQ